MTSQEFHPPTPPAVTDVPLRLRDEPEVKLDNWKAWTGFFAPIVLFVLPAGLLLVVRPDLVPVTWSFYSLSFLAVDLTVTVGVARGAHWWWIVPWVLWGQALMTIFLLWNINVLRRNRRMGKWLAKREEDARKAYEKRKWLRKGHFAGLAAFTILPLGSGIYVGVLLGKATGLSNLKTWGALLTGNIIWVTMLSYMLVNAWDLAHKWLV